MKKASVSGLPPEIKEVTLKNPDQVIHIKSRGLKITKDNLTPERYIALISLSKEYEQYFNVTLNKPTKNESVKLEA